MAITVFPMDATAGAPAYSAKAERQTRAPLYANPTSRTFGTRSGWRVGTLPSIISVSSAQWSLSPCACMIEPASSLYQGSYGWASDQVVTGPVTAADATNARIDILYIQVNDSSSGDGSGALSAPVTYLAGTPSATPAAPALPPRSFLVATINVPKAGGGAPTVTFNAQYFVAAGGTLPVYSQAERDALTPYAGLTIARGDLGWITETWDGSTWQRGSGSAAAVATVTGAAGWTLTGTLQRTRGTAGTQVSANFMAGYGSSAGPFTVSTGFIQALTLNNPGFIPTRDVFGFTTILSSANVVRADCAYNINPSGQLWIRTLSGSYTVQPVDKFYISANWDA